MKRFSFKAKTTILITILITAVCASSIASIVAMSRRVESSETLKSLIKCVERNVDEIEYKNGILNIEDDFAFYSDGVYCEVFDESGNLIEGNAPFAINETSYFKDGKTEKVSGEKEEYYIYDTRLDFIKYEYEIDVFSGQIIKYEADVTMPEVMKAEEYKITKFKNGIDTEQAIDIALSHAGVSRADSTVLSVELPGYENMQVFRIEFTCNTPLYAGVWIRGAVPADYSSNAFSAINKAVIFTFPALILLAALGAFLLSKHTIRPVESISLSAREISSGNDLSKRIEVKSNSDEISTLASTFNGMLERLQASFENEKRFTSDVSHELRTPISVIKAECEFALSEHSNFNDKVEALVSINEQAVKMTDLVNTMLTLTKAEQGKTRFKYENIDLSALVSNVCAEFKTSKGITLFTNIKNNIRFNCNEMLIKQLVLNLVSNADKYGKENGYIKVSLSEENSDVILSVEDNGIGIKDEDIPKLTGRFYRADTSRGETDGFGLGLSLSDNIVALHGGKMLIESEFSVGSKFTVIFSEKN